MSTISLSVEGKLWEVPVQLELGRNSDGVLFGALQVQTGVLDLTKIIGDLLGIEGDVKPSIKLEGNHEIGFLSFNEGKKKYYAIRLALGGLKFQLGTAEGQENKKSYSLSIEVGIEKLLSFIPNVDLSFISGNLSLGIGTGDLTTYQFGAKNRKRKISSGLHLGGMLELGGKTLNLSPSIGEDTAKDFSSVTKENKAEVSGLNKKLGPIALHGFQFKMKGGKAIVLIRADFLLGGFGLHLLGLGVEIDVLKLIHEPKNAFEFKLLGMGVSFKSEAFSIAAFFQKTDADYIEYVGGVSLKTKSFSVVGIGMYAEKDGYKSVFAYIGVNANIGGDPAFFILGLSICFGYNRQFIVPSLDKVARFPLIRYASNPDEGPGTSLMNSDLIQYVPPKKDNFFMGVGLRFTTYKLVDTTALLVLSVGDDLEFTLLGLSRLRLPPAPVVNSIVFIEIALRATYSVKKGKLEIGGRLTHQSFVFSSQVKLSGDFAFHAWFKDDNKTGAKAGEFVISLGGYHPKFKVPSYYPVVPRVAFEWKVGKNLHVSGALYMALTPIAIMAGGQFYAVWQGGGFYAEFNFGADFLISWKPFHYEADLYVSIKAGVKVEKFGLSYNKTINIDAGLQIWGPKFSGIAHIKARVLGIGFHGTIEFGDTNNKKAALLSWEDFKKTFLPNELKSSTEDESPKKGKSEIVSFNLSKGLLEEGKPIEGNTKIWVVNPKELTIEVNTIIPCTELIGKKNIAIEQEAKNDHFYVPVYKGGKLSSKLYIELISPDNTQCDHFETRSISRNMARAMWNDEKKAINENEIVSSKTTISMTTGVQLELKNKLEHLHSKIGKKDDFEFDTEEVGPCSSKTKLSNMNYQDFFKVVKIGNEFDFPEIATEKIEIYS